MDRYRKWIAALAGMFTGAPRVRRAPDPTSGPRFAVGDRVRTRDINRPGQTRLPRYARGRVGVITRDGAAPGSDESVRTIYQVRFEARELWGDDTDLRSAVYLELMEDYLERF
jgi:nitrile hydratase